MGTLTKEQREELASRLNHPWGAVALQCDDDRIDLQVHRSKGMSYRVVVYVNGEWRGEWMSGENNHPEQKYLRKSVRSLMSPTAKAKYVKAVGKRYASKCDIYNATVTTYDVSFASGKAAISHLCKVCKSISIITEETSNALV